MLVWLLGENVVLADISLNLLKLAEQRFEHHKVSQPCAFAHCDAERLPFKSGSFDFVVGFEGIHHCLVPQAALTEIWRVAKKRSFIIDNLECTLTRALYRIGQSSTLEYSGVKPNRFTLGCLETMIHNAKISRYEFRPRATLPDRIHKFTGDRIGRGIEVMLEELGQTNMFTLSAYHEK
jgi:ubiquinone/menaquinone biosynthesis C-methylase UbiE